MNLTSYTPPDRSGGGDVNELKKLCLADSDPFSSSTIDIILGADKFGSCLLPGLIQGALSSLTAQNTIFGWILSGPILLSSIDRSLSITAHQCLTAEVLHEDLLRFWEMEEPPSKSFLTEEELRCEQHFKSTHERLSSGRYMVRLPFKTGPPIEIGNSLHRAKLILNKVQTRLMSNPELFKEYSDFLLEYRQLNHMKRVQDFSGIDAPQTVYLPHHPIIKESSSTTHLRVVLNASSLTTNNTSLNSHFHTGLKLLTDLISIILRWRVHRFVYIADVEKMFRQIMVNPLDWDYQRILWFSGDNKLEAWQLTTVTYGTSCAPYLANRVIKQLAVDEESTFPEVKSILENNIYVDDVLFGSDEFQRAKQLRTQVCQVMESGGFHLRKWASNDEHLLDHCPIGNQGRAFKFSVDEDVQLKVLGLHWNPSSDTFRFRVTMRPTEFPTKRRILSVIARLFDPLGWISPVVIVAKRLMQELWFRKLDWDESLPEDLLNLWSTFYGSLSKLEHLQLPRWTDQMSSNLGCELHGFSDASTRAYSAVVYLRILQETGNAKVSLVFAKSKVAPILPVSIPRLELCGAQLLAKTLRFVIDTMRLESIPLYCHTDSTVVLAWLSKHPSTWRTFVSNRVAQIHQLVPQAKWRHVPTRDNPADCSSRGLFSEQLLSHSLWWQGLSWLAGHSSGWPESRPDLSSKIDLEQKTSVEGKRVAHNAVINCDGLIYLADKFQSWPKLIRVTAYCLRFIDVLLNKIRKSTKSTNQCLTLSLTPSEIQQGSLFWIRRAQSDAFEAELRVLNKGEMISSSSSLKALNAFLDGFGVLRLGGRLHQAPINYSEKHPVILPRHRLSELIAFHAHIRSLHGGLQLTLHTLRQGYWILGGRILVKGLIRNCITCVRERARVAQQLMGSLPDFRTTPCKPFTHTGVDYAGPFNIRFAPGRGQKSYKGYVALFVCCVTRAIHLELVSDCSSQAFLAAYHRFTGRRGKPAHLYSDNGTTFKGADRELRNHINQLARNPDLLNQMSVEGTSWHFIPPSAPHFGGLWEAGVKSLKHHLHRCVGAHTLTFEEFTTALTRIEACLNSRPIGPVSDNPDDFTYLTPGHFLIGTPLTSVPEPSLEFIPENRLNRWQIVQRIAEMFWRRWNVEYLHSVQQRYKWNQESKNIKNGDMVLIRHDTLPPSKWSLGRIIKCYPGKDDLVRTVRVRTAISEYDRPISKICLLPLSLNDSAELSEQSTKEFDK